jgi:hypothetical protein
MSGQTLKEKLNSDRTIVRYLLGESSPQEQTRIEERYFSEPNFLEQVVAVETDLIDAYVRHELTTNERERFENYFLVSHDRRERVEIAEALLTRLAEAPVSSPAPATEAPLPRHPFFALLRPEGLALRFALAGAVLAAVVSGLWLFVENKRLRTQLERAQAEKTYLQQQEQQLQQQLAAREAGNKQSAQAQKFEKPAGENSNQKPAVSTSRTVIASFVLTPGLTRDVEEINRLVIPHGERWRAANPLADVEEINKLVIPHGAQFVRLQINIESRGEYKNYHASLQRVGAGEIWNRTFQRSRGPASKETLAIKLPASLFTSGDYLLTLTGTTATGQVEIAGDYPFTVAKQR